MNLPDVTSRKFPIYTVRWKFPTYFARVFWFELEYNLSDMISRKFPICFSGQFCPTKEMNLSDITSRKFPIYK